jgi:hypothetical protein
MATVPDMVAAYRRIRDRKSEIKEAHVLELRPYNDKLEAIESWLAAQLGDAESIKTDVGTAYKTITATVKVLDRQAALDYILESGSLHLLDLKFNVPAYEEHLLEHQVPVPGTSVARRQNIRVRK